MLIKALCDYYDVLAEKGLVVPEGYSAVPIKYKIVLTPEGKIDKIISCQKTELQPQKNGKEKEILVPERMYFPKRTEKPGIESNTIEHRPLYIFGLNREKDSLNPQDRTGKAVKSHQAFVDRNLEFIDGINSSIVDAFRHFLQSWKPEAETENRHILDLGKDYAGAGFAFCLVGNPDLLLQDDPLIKAKWEREYVQSQSQPGEYQAQCAITGEVSDIARIHSKIKGVAGGASTGGVLIGFNNSSENSYGNDQSYNSNISELAMRKYTEALNYILKQRSHRIIMDDITVAFWAMDGGDEHEMALQEFLMGQSERKPDAEAVNASLKSLLERGMQTKVTTGELKAFDADLDGDIEFYIVGLKPNSSRISVKFIYRKKFLDMLWNVAKFQDELQVSKEVRVVPLSSIKMNCLSLKENTGGGNAKYVPRSRDEKIDPELLSRLLKSIIYGYPYPKALLETVIRKIEIDRYVTKTRAGLVKAYLMNHMEENKEENHKKEEWKVGLDKDCCDIGYLCGRLFAVLEGIQETSAETKLNSTIKDRYYPSVMEKPMMTFTTLEKLSSAHMRKIRNKKPGMYKPYKMLQAEIMDKLEGNFPKRLTLEEQGAFVVGYYQQTLRLPREKKREEEQGGK